MSILVTVGGILILVGWIWNLVVAFKIGGILWGVLNIFFQPLMGIISAAMKKTLWAPVGVMIAGVVICVIGSAAS